MSVGCARWPEHICTEVVGRQGVPSAVSHPSTSGPGRTLGPNHILRNLPPSELSQFAQSHDTSWVGSSERHEVGAGSQLGVLGRLFVPGACPSTTGLHAASPGIGGTTIQSPVCAGSPGRSRDVGRRRRGGARLVQIYGA